MPVLPNGSSGAHQCEQQEEQARDLQPENMHHAADITGGYMASLVESPNPAILARPIARYP